MSAWVIGIQLGPYVLLSHLGAGGMGEVWKARDTRLNRIVAVKRLKSKHSARFEQEARAVAALNHPNICQIFDIGPDYLVLEYIQGVPLAGPAPVAKAIPLAKQIAQALVAAHHQGVIHRDLKPANILVTTEGAIKLLDFGLAKQIVDSDETLTVEGTVVGTAAYMSPEQVTGRRIDTRSDVFSFGAVLYELLSGRRAFSGENWPSTMAAILHKEPAPLDAPAVLQGIVKRCLAKAPGERFQRMAEVVTALESEPEQPVRPSVAVLPFANMSGDKENEYFSDGLAEEIINALAQIPGLKVTARTSAFAFRGKEQDIRKIAEALDVRTILEGSVRRAGSRIRVMACLINAADGSHLWAQRYDREMADIFEFQDEIAQAVASVLQVKLSGAHSAHSESICGTVAPLHQYKPNLPAYEAFLRAYYHLGTRSLALVKEDFEQAIALDPNFAAAHSEYGFYFLFMMFLGALAPDEAMEAVRAQAAKALELDRSLPVGHAMLGTVAGLYDLDWKGAERQFRGALAREPTPVAVRYLHALSYLLPIGRAAEAVKQADILLQEDPLNLFFRLLRAWSLFAAGRDDEACEEARKLLDLDPSVGPAYQVIVAGHVLRVELEQALAFAERACRLPRILPEAAGNLAGLLERMGERQRSKELLQGAPAGDAFGGARARAAFHWACGNVDATADWIENAIDQRDAAAPLMPRLWYGRVLRSTAHWARLMRKLNLPEVPVAPTPH
jgi:eukaryotic-like serine/threonine-protein kinase